MATNKKNNVVFDLKNFIELDDIDSYNYEKTKSKVDSLYAKYRNYKEKREIIMKRSSSNLSFDNLGIYSSLPSDPVGKKIEQADKFTSFLETIDQIYEIYSYQLSKDEKVIYKKMLLSKYTDEEVMTILNMSSKNGLYIRKKSCYIKVARWFDLEVYN